jgi:hypothetical protein
MPATACEKLHAANGDANKITRWLSLCAMVIIGLNHKEAKVRTNIIYCPDVSTSSSVVLSSDAKGTYLSGDCVISVQTTKNK